MLCSLSHAMLFLDFEDIDIEPGTQGKNFAVNATSHADMCSNTRTHIVSQINTLLLHFYVECHHRKLFIIMQITL